MGDQGRGFLRIMRGYERTAAKQRLYESVLRDARYPIQAVWGAKDPALKLTDEGENVRVFSSFGGEGRAVMAA